MARQVPVIRDKAASELEAKRSDRFATRCLHSTVAPIRRGSIQGFIPIWAAEPSAPGDRPNDWCD